VGMVICCPPEKLLDLATTQERDRLISSWIIQVGNIARLEGPEKVKSVRELVKVMAECLNQEDGA
jgi:hypothetical protein